jgi:DNA-3-methyladenine glycosylase I
MEYFENLTRCIFQAGLSWRTIDAKWPGFRKAFDGFSIKKVTSYGPRDLERLMNDENIVRNQRKIQATIHNAQEFQRIAKEHGSFQKWLDGLDKSDNYQRVVKTLMSRFKHVGESTAEIFLYSVGESIHHMP